MPSVGSSRIKQARARDQGAGDGELLLLAAGEVAAAAVEHALEHWEELIDLLRDGAQRLGQRRETGQQVSRRR